MARRRAPKLKLNLAKALKPKKSSLMSMLVGRDQRGNAAYSRRYDLMRFPQY